MMFTDLLPLVLDVHILQWKNIFSCIFCGTLVVSEHISPAGCGCLGVLGFPCARCCSVWFGRLMLLSASGSSDFSLLGQMREMEPLCVTPPLVAAHLWIYSELTLNVLMLLCFRLWNNLELADSKIWLWKFWFLTSQESSMWFCVLQVFSYKYYSVTSSCKVVLSQM